MISTQGFWINNWIARQADINPNQLILIDEKSDRRFTYKTFNESVDRVAAFLKDKSEISKGDRICVISWNRIEMIQFLFASAKLGTIFVPINTRYSTKEIREYVKLIQPKIMVFEEDFNDKIKELKKDSHISSYFELLGQDTTTPKSLSSAEKYPKKLDKPVSVDLEDPVMIIQTGGTTGTPKGSIVTYRMIFWNAMNTIRDLIVPGEVTVTSVPLFHIGGYTYTLPLLVWGGTNVIMNKWNPERLINWIETERVTFQFLVPAQLKMLVETPGFKNADFRSLRWFTTGGAALTRDVVDAMLKKGVIMKQGYGLTEVGPGVFALDPKDAIRKLGSIGKPNLLVDVRVVNDKGKDAVVNEPGELLIRSPSLFGGYWQNAEETKKAVEGGWLHTGDVVRVDEEGFFFIIGREKRVIRSGSESIYPEEVEKVLRLHPKIAEAFVVGVPDKKWGEVPKAFIVTKTGETLDKGEIIRYCLKGLAKYKVPKEIEFVESIPKSSAGKVLKDELMKKHEGR
jgi:acyl-CoA synthetase (AMP-forming)/AMP-acid ligase II